MKLGEILIITGYTLMMMIPIIVWQIFYSPDKTYWNYFILGTVGMMLLGMVGMNESLRRYNHIPSWGEIFDRAEKLSERLDRLEKNK